MPRIHVSHRAIVAAAFAAGLALERIPDSDAVQAWLRQLARVSGVEGAEILQVGT